MLKNKFWKIPLIVVFCFFVSNCTSMGGGVVNGSTISKKDYGSPKTHTLFFGYCRVDGGSFGFGDSQIYAQVNPAKGAMLLIPRIFRTPSFFIVPVEPTTKIRLINSYFTTLLGQYQTTYRLYSALTDPEEATLVFTAEKPGLQYVGAFVRHVDSYTRERASYELVALKDIKDFFKGTEWATVIDARIKELEK